MNCVLALNCLCLDLGGCCDCYELSVGLHDLLLVLVYGGCFDLLTLVCWRVADVGFC